MNTSKNQLHTTHNTQYTIAENRKRVTALRGKRGWIISRWDAKNTARECKIPARNARASDGPVGGSTQRIDRILQRSAILQNKKKRQALFRLAEKLADRPRRRGRLSGLRDAGTGLRQTQRDPLGATSPKHDLLPKGNTSSWRGNKEGGPGTSRRGSRQHDAG